MGGTGHRNASGQIGLHRVGAGQSKTSYSAYELENFRRKWKVLAENREKWKDLAEAFAL